MKKDLMTAEYKEGELRKNYENYFVPAVKILVGSKERDLASHYKVQIEQIQVSLNLREAASASFTVTNIYNLKSRSINQTVKNTLKPGTFVKVKLGYGSDLEDVFHGFIYESAVQFGDMPSLQITALDVRRLMSDNQRENYAWQKNSYAKIFQAIMKNYEKLKLSLQVEDTEEWSSKTVIQRGNDLEMVYKLCQAADKRFIVFGDRAYFMGKEETKPITTLLWGQELLSFSQTPIYMDTEIEVRGNLRGSNEVKVEKRTVTAKDSICKVCQKSTKVVITMTDIESVKELENRADKEEKSLKQRIKSGKGSCVGIPVLIPGRYVRIKGLDADADGLYYLESVSHSFGSDGFTTDFTLGRNESGFYGELMEKDKKEKKEKEDRTQKATGIMRGQVTDNWDQEHPGMVKVQMLLGEQENNDMGWVPVAVPYAGNAFGSYLLPEIGSQVLIGFHMGQLESPYVIGCLWNNTNVLPEETANEKNTVKTILTKGGNRIVISDEEGKERISLKTKGELSLDLDDENRKITIRDKEGENTLQLDAKEGVMTFAAKEKAVFQVGGKEMFTLEKNGSKVSAAADNICIKAKQKLNLKGQNTSLEGGSTDISGDNVKLEAQKSLGLKGSGSLKAESGGTVEVKGLTVKLN